MRTPLQVLGQTLAKAWQDRILGLSAEASFWQVLSIPPLLIGLLGTLGYLGDVIGDDSVTQIEERLLAASAEVVTPNVVDTLVAPTLNDILAGGRLDVVSLGFLLALWAGSSATATFMNTIVIAYDQRDVRGPVRTRLKALWLFIVGLGMAVLTLPLLVLGREVLVSLLPDDWEADGDGPGRRRVLAAGADRPAPGPDELLPRGAAASAAVAAAPARRRPRARVLPASRRCCCGRTSATS